jgi:hypothetical protein
MMDTYDYHTLHKPTFSPNHLRSGDDYYNDAMANQTKLSPYSVIGGSLLAGASVGLIGASMRPLSRVEWPTNRERLMVQDGFEYRETLDDQGKVGSIERKAIDSNMDSGLHRVNPDMTIHFAYKEDMFGQPERLPKQIDVTLPIHKTYDYTVERVENNEKKLETKQGTLSGEVTARYVSPEFQSAPKTSFPIGLTELQHREKGKLKLDARVDTTNKTLTYTDYTTPTPSSKTIDLNTLKDDSSHLLLDLRESLKSHVPVADLKKDPKTGLSNADRYQRISTKPVDSKQYTWHPTAVEKLETHFHKAMRAYNGFSEIDEALGHKRLAYRTQGGIVGGIIGLTAGISVWCYSKWKERHSV